jgi:hypothetical protein
MHVAHRRDHIVAHAERGAQPELLLLLVEHVDRACFGAGNLRRPRDDGIEHGLEIERRVDRLGDLAERAQLLDRAREFTGAGTQFIEQPCTKDQETLGLAGAIYKRLWELSAQERHLATSLAYYYRGYEQGVESDYGYTAINAAFVLDLLADIESVAGQPAPIVAASAAQRRSLV